MADADRLLSGEAPLDILAFAILPFLENGAPAFAGGGCMFNAALLPRLAGLGHEVRVVAEAPAARRGVRRAPLPWSTPHLAVEWFAYENRSSLEPPSAAFRAGVSADIRRAFERSVGERRPDVVLIGREMVSLYVLELCREHDLPAVLICHGVGLRALAEGLYPDALAAELVDCLRGMDAVVAIARHIETRLRDFGVKRVQTIPNVVDPDVFRPAQKDRALLDELHIAPGRLVVGHASVLRPMKRPIDIVDSAALVLRARPETVYLVIGEGPCRSEMEERAARHGIASSFRFVGEIGHDEMPSYLNVCDLVLLPSDMEGLPLICLEAQACGRLTVASDIPALRELIVDGETGLLFQPGNVGALAEKTLVALGSPALRDAVGGSARALAVTRTPSRWSRAYADVLRGAVAGWSTTW